MPQSDAGSTSKPKKDYIHVTFITVYYNSFISLLVIVVGVLLCII